MLKTLKKILILILACYIHTTTYSQYIDLKPEYNISKTPGDELFPSWSMDGNKLVFQSNRNGNWDIFQYDIINDTVSQLTNEVSNEQYPVLLNKKNKLAFTSDVIGEDHIYLSDIPMSNYKAIFQREIYSKAATFPKSEYLLYCLGYNNLAKQWGLYRYEFKYSSLKLIIPLQTDHYLPKVASDGETIMVVEKNRENWIDQLSIINWYGNTEHVFSDYNFIDPAWYPGGLKIIFVSDMDNEEGEIYTIWKDGSHLERWTNDTISIKNPVVSPNEKFIAVSVKLNDGYDLFVLPLEDYK